MAGRQSARVALMIITGVFIGLSTGLVVQVAHTVAQLVGLGLSMMGGLT